MAQKGAGDSCGFVCGTRPEGGVAVRCFGSCKGGAGRLRVTQHASRIANGVRIP